MSHLNLTMTLHDRNISRSPTSTPIIHQPGSTLNIIFSDMTYSDYVTGLTEIGVLITGPNGETIGRKTRRARVQGKEEADCLAVSDALEWANQLNCKAFYLQGNNTRINKTLQGSARLTSWKTNSRMDQLLLLLSSLDVFICKNIKYKNVTSLQNLAKAGVRNPSPPI